MTRPRRALPALITGVAVPSLLVAATVGVAVGVDFDRTQEVRAAAVGGQAKNIILLIGDGMGDSNSPSHATTSTAPRAGWRWTRCRSRAP